MILRITASVLLTVLLHPVTTAAHELGIARITLSAEEDNRLTIDVRTDAAVSAAGIALPPNCQGDGERAQEVIGGDDRWTWHFQCGDAQFTPDDQLILTWPVEGVFVATAKADEVAGGQFFDEEEGQIVLPLAEILNPTRSGPGSFMQYLRFGIEHILSGWDHLAFVLALCLIAAGWRLFKLVTAFTIGHSITLALAATGHIGVPAPPLEACIALSIAFIAREAILNRDKQHGYLIVLGFGLLHGLGFARALGEAGVGADNLVAALLAFNIGVEIGQLLFVAAVLLVTRYLTPAAFSPKLRPVVAYGVGGLGVFWTIERVTQFFA